MVGGFWCEWLFPKTVYPRFAIYEEDVATYCRNISSIGFVLDFFLRDFDSFRAGDSSLWVNIGCSRRALWAEFIGEALPTAILLGMRGTYLVYLPGKQFPGNFLSGKRTENHRQKHAATTGPRK